MGNESEGKWEVKVRKWETKVVEKRSESEETGTESG